MLGDKGVNMVRIRISINTKKRTAVVYKDFGTWQKLSFKRLNNAKKK